MAERSRELGRLVDTLQTRVRALIVPLGPVAAAVLDGGAVLDLGCGQGLLIAAFAHRVERVVGVDLDERKCRMARQALAGRSAGAGAIEIVRADLLEYLARTPSAAFRSVVLSDTLSAIDLAVQDRILAEVVRVLEPGGRLVLKIVDAEPRWKASASRLISTMVCSGLKLSLSTGQRFRYRSSGEYEAALRAHRLAVTTVSLHRRHVVPHMLLLGDKP